MRSRSSRQRSASVAGLAGPPVRVKVRNMAGEMLEMDLDAASMIQAVKVEIARVWRRAPVMCQRLLVGAATPEDADTLSQLLPEGAHTLELMCVVSLEEAQRCLRAPEDRLRQAALDALADVAPRGHRGAFAFVSALLGDGVSSVRASALQVLSRVACEEDERALELILARLADTHADVRRAAVRIVAQRARNGSASVVAALGGRLADPSVDVIHEAAFALSHLVPKCDEPFARIVLDHFRHKRPEVRIAALHAVTQNYLDSRHGLVAAPPENVLLNICALVEDRDKDVQQEARMALAQLVPDVGERSIVNACARLLHGRASARMVAMKTLAREAPVGSAKAIHAICACVQDRANGLRVEAMKALYSLARKGDEEAAAAIVKCLHDPRAEVKVAALRVFPHVVPASDERAIAVVSALTKDPSLKDAAAQALSCLDHSGGLVREAVRGAFGSPAAHGAVTKDGCCGVMAAKSENGFPVCGSDCSMMKLRCSASEPTIPTLKSLPTHVPRGGTPSVSLGAPLRQPERGGMGGVRNPLFAAASMIMA